LGGGQFAIELAVEFRQRFGRNFGFGHKINSFVAFFMPQIGAPGKRSLASFK
jgi:hypothetical protein